MARLGQHFLRDRNVAATILGACGPLASRTVLEIGPGKGALTLPLLGRGARVHAIELDPRLAALLPNHPALTVTIGDAARVPWPRTDLLVSNLPFEITSPVLERLAHEPRPAVLMVQREVAERIRAGPGPSMGRLTVAVQLGFAVAPVCRVRRGAFQPPPEVTAEVLRLDPIPQPPEAAAALALARHAFTHRRKRLSTTMKATPWGNITPQLERLRLGPRRPQELAVADWVRLAQEVGPRPS